MIIIDNRYSTSDFDTNCLLLCNLQDKPGSMKKREKCSKAKFKEDLDRVEAAFRKFDTDGDGFIDWEEFKQVSKNLNSQQAKRIYDTCDQVG